MKESINQIVSEIITRDSFHPSEFEGLFDSDVGHVNFNKAIHAATEVAREQHRVVFRADGTGRFVRVVGAAQIADRAATFRRTSMRKAARAADLYDCAIEAAADGAEAARLIQRRARASDIAFDRAKPSPFAMLRRADDDDGGRAQ